MAAMPIASLNSRSRRGRAMDRRSVLPSEKSERERDARRASEVLRQIHPGVKACHLAGVAVERQRLAASELADAALLGLAPARVIDRGIDVGIEAVLARRIAVPGRGWLG